jgi:cation/acetate symporter
MLSSGVMFLVGTGLAVIAMTAVALRFRSRNAHAHASGGAAFSTVGGGLSLSGLFALASLILLPGLIHQHGYDALIPMVGLSGGLLLLTVLVGPALTRSGAASLPDLIAQRFGRFARILTLVVALAATGGLLLGTLSAGLSLAARVFEIPIGAAALAAAAAIIMVTLPGGLKSVLANSAMIALLVGLALISLTTGLYAVLLGNPLPHLAYGQVLSDIAPAELSLIENGLVDFGVFKPFLRKFLTVDRLNWALLTISLAAAVAALPPLVQATGVFAPSASPRRGLAWMLTFVVIALTALPAIAALARIETYRAVAADSTFAELPHWIRRASQADAVRLHGASLGLVETVAHDVTAGARSINAVSAAMTHRGARAEANWQRLDPSVQEAVLDLARRFAASPGLPLADRWLPFTDTVVTAAAVAAGNISGKPNLATVSIDPQLILLALPHAAGLPLIVSAVFVAIVFAAAIVLAAALVVSLATMLVHDGSAAFLGRKPDNATELTFIRFTGVAVAIGAAMTAAVIPVTADVVFTVSLLLAAAGLLPALILTVLFRRATAAGILAAVIAGLALGTYYLAGTAIYSVSFYEAWPKLSSGGPSAFTEYVDARDLWIASEGDDRAAAYADLSARTTGSLWSPGLANWFGIAPAAAPALALPFALLVGLLVSVITGRPSPQSLIGFDRLHGRNTNLATPVET